jgi:putative transposase
MKRNQPRKESRGRGSGGMKRKRAVALDIRSVIATLVVNAGETALLQPKPVARDCSHSSSPHPPRPESPKGDLRRFLEGVVGILRTGAPWRDLAERFGRWDRVYRRYRRWALAGRWEALRTLLSRSEHRGFLLIDSTIVKAHPHAAGALCRYGGQTDQAREAVRRAPCDQLRRQARLAARGRRFREARTERDEAPRALAEDEPRAHRRRRRRSG